jgi:hypothetical protein
MTTTMTREYAERRLVNRAWRDEAFLKELLANPKAAAAQELGVEFEDDAQVVVHQEPPNSLHIVLPMKPADITEAEEGTVFLRDQNGVFFEIPADILYDYAVSEGERLQVAAKVWEGKGLEVEGQWWVLPNPRGTVHWRSPNCGVRG